MPKKKSEHYVNNKELLEALIVYKSKVAKASEIYFQKYNGRALRLFTESFTLDGGE